MKRISAIAVLGILALTAPFAGESPTLFQQPTVSGTHIVFAYGGDLWRVERDGGRAVPLTTGIGIEANPRFSPDGGMVAFTGRYEGNTDVYVVAADGGVPQRLTYHPGGDQVVGWSSDGEQVLFRSRRASHRGFMRLFTVAVAGGLPQELPLPMAYEGSYSANARHVAYQPITQWQPDWKRHKGGQAGKIWIARMSDSSVEAVPRKASNDISPQWLGEKVYFLSDRNGPVSIFAYDTRTKEVRQELAADGLDIKSMSAGPDILIYEQFGTLYLLEPGSGAGRQVDIQVEGDFAGVRTRYAKVGDQIRAGSISPSGVRGVFEARGEIITVPAEKGDPRNLTNTPGIMERDPAWSPDGSRVAYFSDAGGEYALHIRDQKGEEEASVIDLGTPPSFYSNPVWSPDSQRIAYADRRLNLWYVDVDKGEPVQVDTNPVGFSGAILAPHWSADSAWLAYARHLPNLMRAVFVYSVETGASHQITDGLSDAAYPQWDRGGKYLYFAVSTDIGPGLSWADLSGISHVSTRSVYAAVLRQDLPSPLAPESDEEKADDEESEEPGDEGDQKKGEGKEKEKSDAAGKDKGDGDGENKGQDKGGKSKSDKPDPVTIDLEGIDQRIIALPIAAGNILGLAAAGEGTLFVAVAPPNHFGRFGDGVNLRRFDLKKQEEEDYLEGVSAYEVSADGQKMLYRKGRGWTIAGTTGKPKPGEGDLKTSGLQVRVEPPAEWRQMFQDAWRGQRDHFYDANLHGLDLDAARALYEPYLDAVVHREDLNYLFREMLNQLTIGHMFISGGDMADTEDVGGGLLGCDFTIHKGHYRLARVLQGENWNPDLRAPLTEPGVNVEEGEYLLAVNGRELTGSDNVHAFLENTAGKQTVLRVADNVAGDDARDITVVPVRNESALRNRTWITDNRRRVDELSGGRLAYIYIPNTSTDGYSSFNRYFFAQTDRQGAVVDERFNQGGLLADYVANYLTRPQLSAIAFRYKDQDIPVPGGAIYGPKAMLINSMAGSGGDAMPWYFRKMNVGPLIGTRTWGGLVASRQGPRLMDGGRYTAPDAAVYGLDGRWDVENAGVAPDIEVELDPAAWRQGRDVQLERAVAVLLEALEANPRPEVIRPPYPVYERCCGLDR